MRKVAVQESVRGCQTRAPPSRPVSTGTYQPGQERDGPAERCHEPLASSGDRAASKTEEQDNLHRHSDPYGRESADVQRWSATVTPGTASYRGGSQQESNGGSQLSPQAQRPIGERVGPELSPQAQRPI